MADQQGRAIQDKAWFAGILEGEGWFSMVKDSHREKKSNPDN